MKVKKVGSLDDENNLNLSGAGAKLFLTILRPTGFTPDEFTAIFVPILIGRGEAERRVVLDADVPTKLLKAQRESPTNMNPNEGFIDEEGEVDYAAPFMFRNQAFLVTTEFVDSHSEEEAILLIKKEVFTVEKRLMKLRLEVDAIERSASLTGKYKREAIPEAVKLVVWDRDDGQCVRCGSKQNLHYDHIIPVSKGGGNLEDNVQLLCAACNLEKSTKIGF
jgi:hypothetical protein